MKSVCLLPLVFALSFAPGCETGPPAERAARERAEHQRQADHEQRHQQEDLRNRFKRFSTAELKLMHARYAQLAGLNTSRDAGLNPVGSALFGSTDRRNTESLIEVERELLRRWKAGDEEARLPSF